MLQPVVITVNKDRSVKIALEARTLKYSIAKDKYQMPNFDSLMDEKEGQVLYSLVDINYAYVQVQLDESTAKHCNFQVKGRQSTVIYRFIT